MIRSGGAISTATQPEASSPSAGPTRSDVTLSVRNIEVVYNDVILVLRGVSLDVGRGRVVALLGANGAGKTTLLRAITGLLHTHHGKITKGSVHLEGHDVTRSDAARIVALGLGQVMEGRRIFAELTVEENLRAGGYTVRDKAALSEAKERVFALFPKLAERERQVAGYLSGGEQQMLAIGRALMANPQLLLLDEPSLGLAPKIVEQVQQVVVDINRLGTSVLLVEQNATMALEIADHGYVLEHGKVVKDGPGAALLADKDIQEFYLGIGEAGRKSFRDVKSYRRRKSWGS